MEDAAPKDRAKRENVGSDKKSVSAGVVFTFYPFWQGLWESIQAAYITSSSFHLQNDSSTAVSSAT